MLGNYTKVYSGNGDFEENLMGLLKQVYIKDILDLVQMVLPH